MTLALLKSAAALHFLNMSAVEGLGPLPDDSPLWDMPNVLITPHSMSTGIDENERLTTLFCDNLRRYLALPGPPAEGGPGVVLWGRGGRVGRRVQRLVMAASMHPGLGTSLGTTLGTSENSGRNLAPDRSDVATGPRPPPKE